MIAIPVIVRFVVLMRNSKTQKEYPYVWIALLDRMPSTTLLVCGSAMAKVAIRSVYYKTVLLCERIQFRNCSL